MKKFFTIAFILIAAAVTYGQKNGFAGYIRIASMDIPDAKSVTPQILTNVSGFPQKFTGIGGELSYKYNRIIADAEMLLLTQRPVNTGEHFAEQFAGSIIAKTGFVIAETRNFYIYPVAGAGLGSMFVTTYDKQSGTKELLHTSYLIQPILDAGIHTDIIIYWFKNSMPSGALPVGVRTGYHFAGPSDNWKRLTGRSMKREFSSRGWYISIALGMGYYQPSKRLK